MCILFDLDGTLLDTAPDFLLAINALRRAESLHPLPVSTLPALKIAISHGIENILKVAFTEAERDNKQQLLKEALLSHYFEALGKAAKPFPGMEDLLQTLEAHQIPWGIVTNKREKFTQRLLQKLLLNQRAACIVSGDTTLHPKPHPEPLLYACRQLHLLPQQCLYVGDAERDIIAGNAAGMTTLVALFGYLEDIQATQNWRAHGYVEAPQQIWPWYDSWKRSL